MVSNQLRHDLAAHKTLPLNGFEKVAIISAVLIPCWTYRGLFLGNRQHMAQWDDKLLYFLQETPRAEPRMNAATTYNNRPQGQWYGPPPRMGSLYNALGYTGPE